MMGRMIRNIAAATLLTTAASTMGCGYFFHPERRGNTGGSVDAASLVMDLLWLIPGIVPGVIALIVDFSSGAIYTGGGHSAVRMSSGHVAVRIPEAPNPARIELRLVTSDHRILAHKIADIGPGVRAHSVDLVIADPASRSANEKVFLEVVTAKGSSARFPVAMEMTR